MVIDHTTPWTGSAEYFCNFFTAPTVSGLFVFQLFTNTVISLIKVKIISTCYLDLQESST